MKVLIEGVVKVDVSQPLVLSIAVFLANLISGHAYMNRLPLLALTCSTTEFSADLLIILSSFGVVPITFIPLMKLPHYDRDPQGLCPLAGQKFGPPFFDSLLSTTSAKSFGSWDPLSYLRLILDSLRGVDFECASQGKDHTPLFSLFFVVLRVIFFPYVVPGLILPEVLSLFNSDETTSFVLFLTRKWETVIDLLSLPDLMSGLGGLRAHMILGPQNTRCFRHCLLAVTEVVSLLRETCLEMNRGMYLLWFPPFQNYSQR